ncbi:unnamed protein product [Gadus morhua 'NCC']
MSGQGKKVQPAVTGGNWSQLGANKDVSVATGLPFSPSGFELRTSVGPGGRPALRPPPAPTVPTGPHLTPPYPTGPHRPPPAPTSPTGPHRPPPSPTGPHSPTTGPHRPPRLPHGPPPYPTVPRSHGAELHPGYTSVLLL